MVVQLDEAEVVFLPIRAQGAGGQNVNKVSSAVHLRFDILASSLPEEVKQRLLALGGQRINADGVIVIKAQTQRSMARNREEGLARLRELIDAASRVPKVRRPTRPTRSSQMRRVEGKVKRGALKAGRRRVDGGD